jgi:hypothetical protein
MNYYYLINTMFEFYQYSNWGEALKTNFMPM